jgi:hypothetical protein
MSKLQSVKVLFNDSKYNYITPINWELSEKDIRDYFVNTTFDLGGYPEEDMQKCTDIELLGINEY